MNSLKRNIQNAAILTIAVVFLLTNLNFAQEVQLKETAESKAGEYSVAGDFKNASQQKRDLTQFHQNSYTIELNLFSVAEVKKARQAGIQNPEPGLQHKRVDRVVLHNLRKKGLNFKITREPAEFDARKNAGSKKTDVNNSSTVITAVPAQDSLALVAFYNSTNGLSWRWNDNWLSANPVSTWFGVTVLGGRVTLLSLGNNQLSGSIPPEIGNLTNLEWLLLHNNQLSGLIPPEIGNLTNLWKLYLYDNQLSGLIPPEIGNLTNLEWLLLHNNQLSGPIPPEIRNLTSLKVLDLGNNQLNGSIPPEIGNLTDLYNLVLENNQLSGSIPPEIGNLTNLEYLYLNNNQFSDLPGLSPLSSLWFLKIQENRFTFEDIEPNITVPNFTYSPQAKVGESEYITKAVGSSVTFSVSVGGTANQYQWFKDGIVITGATGTNYTINNLDIGDAGSYTCQITNTIATELILESNPKNLVVVEGPNSITVTSPNGGETWYVGTAYDITWGSDRYVGDVKIEISTTGGATWWDITEGKNTPNDGIYSYTPNENNISDHCLFRITSAPNPAVKDQSDTEFKIKSSSTDPTLSVNPTTLDFGTSAISKTFDISNAGSGTLNWQATENPDKAWITGVTPSNGTNNGTVTVTVDRSNLSGNSDSGTLVVSSNGGTINVTVTIAEAVPRAVRFAASGDYVEVPHSNSIAPSEFTIEFWLRVNALGDPQIAGGEQTIIDKRGEYDTGYNFRLAGTTFPLSFHAIAGLQAVSTANTILQFIWYHIAVTQGSDSLKLYLDGEHIWANANVYPADTNAPLRIGEFLGYPDAYLGLRGDIDEMRVWNTARNQAAIQATMYRKLTGSEARLAAYWDFDSESGGIISDLTTNGNHGVMYSNTTLIDSDAPIGLIPVLSINPTSLDFGTSATGKTFDISNAGSGVLSWSVSENESWITSVSPTGGTENGTVTVTVDRVGLSPGDYSGKVTVSSNGGNIDVAVNMTVSGFTGLWTVQQSGTMNRLNCVTAVSGDVAWIAGENGTVLLTTDGGETWADVWSFPDTMNCVNIEVLENNTALLCGVAGEWPQITNTYIYRTNNYGTSWTKVFEQAGGFLNDITMLNQNDGVAIGNHVDGVWTILKTADSGFSWTQIADAPQANASEHPYFTGVTWVDNSTCWFGLNVPAAFRSADEGTSWDKVDIPPLDKVITIDFNQPGFGLAASYNAMAKTNDNGANWQDIAAPGDGYLFYLLSHQNKFWLLRDKSIYNSENNGSNWEIQAIADYLLRYLAFTTDHKGTHGWAVGDNGTILKYEEEAMFCLLGDVNMDVLVTPGDALCAFQIYLNGGTPQGDCDTECALQAADINCTPNGITPGDALYIFQAYLSGKIPPLDCDPSNFDKKSTGFELSLSEVEVINGEDVFVSILVNKPEGLTAFGLDVGYPDELLSFVKVSGSNLTENWQALDGKENISGTVTIGGFNHEAINSDKLGALITLNFKINEGIEGRGDLWLFNLTDDLAGAEVSSGFFSTNNQSTAEIPATYALQQNYPNPFNPETTIGYQLPHSAEVVLKIYDLQGHEVRMLEHGIKSAGFYVVNWDGRNDQGSKVSSGIYFYKIKMTAKDSEHNSFMAVKKMILIK